MRLPKSIVLRAIVAVPLFVFLLVWAFAVQSPAGAAQQVASTDNEVPSSDRTIRVSTDLILVPVSVTDAERRPVSDLRQEDFQILEEGKRQQITNLELAGQSPVELALLIDISGSVSPRFKFEQQAGAAFLKGIVAGQRPVTIFSIGPEPELLVPRTAIAANAVRGLLGIRPTRQSTAFFDSVSAAARYLDKTALPFSRRVQIVISDGEDNFSLKENADTTLRELQQADCLFYSINPASPSLRLNLVSRKGQESMAFLANQTGGAAFVPKEAADFQGIFDQIGTDLQAQYLLGYYSSERTSAGGYRKIRVTVPQRPELRVRSRHGYFVPAAGQAG